MSGALTRYRLIAYVVGVVLILLMVVGMPMKYLFSNAIVVETIGPAHGFLYMVYLVAAFDLARRAGWSLGRILAIMLAGTVPFVSFWAERVVTRWSREAIEAQEGWADTPDDTEQPLPDGTEQPSPAGSPAR